MTGSFGYQTTTRPRVEVLNAYMRGVYQWMGIGLLLTGVLAYTAANVPALGELFFRAQPVAGGGYAIRPTLLFWGAIIGEFGLVFYISARIAKLSGQTATMLFLAYSALNGLTLSYIFLIYTQTSIVRTFVVCSAMFGAMSIYGLVTKKDLTSWGSFLFMGLIGIIIAMVVNIFLKSTMMHMLISFAGVIIFTGLTAYDTQKLKVMGEMVPAGDGTALRRGTILGALTLYLDFINLFLMLLRLMGSARD